MMHPFQKEKTPKTKRKKNEFKTFRQDARPKAFWARGSNEGVWNSTGAPRKEKSDVFGSTKPPTRKTSGPRGDS